MRKPLMSQKSKSEFKLITLEELESVIGIHIYMGIKRLNAKRNHCSVDEWLGSPVVRKTILRDRFLFIDGCLRFYKRESNIADPLHKVNRLVNTIPEIALNM